MKRELFDDEHEQFRTSVRRWLDKEVVPHHVEWDEAGIVPRSLFTDAGRHGFLGMAMPEAFGGGGVDDFRYNLVHQRGGAGRPASAPPGSGLTLHNDICLPYFLRYCSDEQRDAVAARHRIRRADHRRSP